MDGPILGLMLCVFVIVYASQTPDPLEQLQREMQEMKSQYFVKLEEQDRKIEEQDGKIEQLELKVDSNAGIWAHIYMFCGGKRLNIKVHVCQQQKTVERE